MHNETNLTRRKPTVSLSLKEYARGIIGGLLFSLPLLYTMEVWWHGFVAQPQRLIIGIIATFCLLLGYNRFAGLRADSNFREVVVDSVEELGLGILISALLLWLLGRITSAMTWHEIVGKIVVEALGIAVGVSVGTAQLGAADHENQGMENTKLEEERGLFADIVLALCGGMLLALNIAPTEEIFILAMEINIVQLIILCQLSIILAMVILFFSDFNHAPTKRQQGQPRHILHATFITYVIALLASALCLWFFGQFDHGSVRLMITQIIILSVASALGASAGRLLLQ